MAASDSDSGSSHGAWSEVARGILKESQEDSDETQKCDACRTDSSASSNHADSISSTVCSTSSWWAELIKIHSQQFVPEGSSHLIFVLATFFPQHR